MEYSDSERNLLEKIGLRLREARIAKNDTQEEFSARIGVSRNILGKMEKGDPSVAFGRWLKAASCLGLLETFANCFEQEADPFEVFDLQQSRVADLRKTRVRKGVAKQ